MRNYLVPSISPTPTPPPTPSPTPEEDVLSEKYAKLHPVLFIHGLNSYPELWRDAQGGSDYVSLLRDWGYPREYIALYSYTGEGVGMHGYNNQGHVPIVALGMYAKIKQLCEASIMHGGDGKVDIIAHSMGGLVARQFISEYPKNNCIDKVITIGTPFQGSWLLSGNSSQGFIDKKLNDLTVGQLAKLILGLEPGSYALTDMDLKSEFIQNLDLLPYNPSIEYSTIYGSIDTDIFMRLFNLELISKIGDVGDLVVSGFSASTVSPFQPSTKYKFSDTDRYRIPAYMQSISKFGFSIGFDFSTIGSLRYMHTEIYKQPEVKARILKILRNEI